jgi:hypothetical protein
MKVNKNSWKGRDEEENKLETKITKNANLEGSPSLGGAHHAQQWQGGQRIYKRVPGDHQNTVEALWRCVGRIIESILKRGKKALTLSPERP